MIHKRRLAVVNVRDDCDVSYILSLVHVIILMVWCGFAPPGSGSSGGLSEGPRQPFLGSACEFGCGYNKNASSD
jgi:hypothetical protein